MLSTKSICATCARSRGRITAGIFRCTVPSLRGEAGHGGAVWADCATILPTVLYRFYGDRGQLARDYPMMRDYCDLLLCGVTADEGGRGLITRVLHLRRLARAGRRLRTGAFGRDRRRVYQQSVLLSLPLPDFRCGGGAGAFRWTCDRLPHRGGAGTRGDSGRISSRRPAGLTVDTQTAYVLALRFGVYRNRRRSAWRFPGAPAARLLPYEDRLLRHDSPASRRCLPAAWIATRTAFCSAADCPGWLYAVDLGATTVWERWNSLLPDGRISGIEHELAEPLCLRRGLRVDLRGHCGTASGRSAGWRSAADRAASRTTASKKCSGWSYASVAGALCGSRGS